MARLTNMRIILAVSGVAVLFGVLTAWLITRGIGNSLRRIIAGLTDGRGVDVIVEMLANQNLDQDLKAVALKGRIVIVGSRGHGTNSGTAVSAAPTRRRESVRKRIDQPMARPTRTGTSDSRTTMPTTLRCCAPSAMRIPISLVRCVTA